MIDAVGVSFQPAGEFLVAIEGFASAPLKLELTRPHVSHTQTGSRDLVSIAKVCW